MKIKDLIKKLQEGNPDNEVSIETIDDEGDIYYETQIDVTWDDNGEAGIYARNK